MKEVFKDNKGIKIIFDTELEREKFFQALDNSVASMCVRDFMEVENWKGCPFSECSNCWKSYINVEVRNDNHAFGATRYGISSSELDSLRRDVIERLRIDFAQVALKAGDSASLMPPHVFELKRKYKAILLGLGMCEDDINDAMDKVCLHSESIDEQDIIGVALRSNMYDQFEKLVTDTLDDPLYNIIVGSGSK